MGVSSSRSTSSPRRRYLSEPIHPYNPHQNVITRESRLFSVQNRPLPHSHTGYRPSDHAALSDSASSTQGNHHRKHLTHQKASAPYHSMTHTTTPHSPFQQAPLNATTTEATILIEASTRVSFHAAHSVQYRPLPLYTRSASRLHRALISTPSQFSTECTIRTNPYHTKLSRTIPHHSAPFRTLQSERPHNASPQTTSHRVSPTV